MVLFCKNKKYLEFVVSEDAKGNEKTANYCEHPLYMSKSKRVVPFIVIVCII